MFVASLLHTPKQTSALDMTCGSNLVLTHIGVLSWSTIKFRNNNNNNNVWFTELCYFAVLYIKVTG